MVKTHHGFSFLVLIVVYLLSAQTVYAAQVPDRLPDQITTAPIQLVTTKTTSPRTDLLPENITTASIVMGGITSKTYLASKALMISTLDLLPDSITTAPISLNPVKSASSTTTRVDLLPEALRTAPINLRN